MSTCCCDVIDELCSSWSRLLYNLSKHTHRTQYARFPLPLLTQWLSWDWLVFVWFDFYSVCLLLLLFHVNYDFWMIAHMTKINRAYRIQWVICGFRICFRNESTTPYVLPVSFSHHRRRRHWRQRKCKQNNNQQGNKQKPRYVYLFLAMLF